MAAYQSLYRRYRSQRFDEVLGQDHVTRALRNAVRDDRVGHAYLFSGPRGTGKTSTARILAKVLNCAAPEDGEPCGTCESCVAVAEGRVTDWLLEQDAASKSKVDDMRDLLERVPLGTSGNRKVIILDEVHMLSQGAENALLKTLEEPPPHVVFVLATTDPQKVRPTIRSRTQHFEFRLLPPDLLAAHVRHVIEDAGLLGGVDIDEVVEHVVRSGGGSARDTLSALDQVAALGEVVDEAEPVDAVVDALCAGDAGKALVAVADAMASGRDARTLGQNVIAALRDAFLSVMGAADRHLPAAARQRAAQVGEALGPAGLTRALDVLGEALTELARKPDPRIVLEVALVRITEPAADRTLDAVLVRLDRLERAMAAGTGVTGMADATTLPSTVAGTEPPDQLRPASGTPAAAAEPEARAVPTSPGAGPGTSAAAARDALSSARGTARRRATGAADGAPTPTRGGARGRTGAADPTSVKDGGPGGSRPTLGAVARRSRAGGTPPTPGDAGVPAPGDAGVPSAGGPGAPPAGPAAGRRPPGGAVAPAPPPATPSRATDAGTAREPTPSATAESVPTVGELDAVWTADVLASLPVKVRSKWRAGRWLEPEGAELRFAVPNEWHKKACDEVRAQVEKALGGHFGRALAVGVVVAPEPGPVGPLGPGGARSGGAAPGRTGRAPDVDDEAIDPSELRDAGDVATHGVELVLREFGGELLEEDE
ncbi:MAG TPA: DNA polymerase III subunit gamma/tau [Acidimicrobiales bacterium]|nr:DNA polymerase III subunit gamma/tau [Acidimicrobiales bacterium]